MKKNLFALLIFLPLSVWGQSVHQEILFEGLTGNELLDSLVVHYKPSTVLSYDDARDLMFSEIYNEDGINICVYTGDTIEIPFGDPNPRTIANAHVPNWNTEHVYPQSKGAGSGNARRDLHHLMPVRGDVNSSRGNSPFGFVDDNDVTTWWGENGSQTTLPSGDTSEWSKAMGSSRFEPMDATKGNLARAVFYFYTMYRAQAEAADPTFFQAQFEALREFHNHDKVDALEVERTFQIADVQSDKPNPFVIDTTLVRRIFFENFEFEPQVVEGEYFADFAAFSSGSKGSFAEGTVDLNGISWTMSNALIGSLDGDMKIEERSARLRHESDEPALIRMEGDKSMGLGTVSFYYSRSDFSGDRSGVAPAFVVEYSVDQGENWTQTGPVIDLEGVNELTAFESEINHKGIGRIRMRSVSGGNGKRFNIDNILITNFIETNAELTITGREGWRMLSSPVQSVTLSELLATIFTQGFPGADFEGENIASNVFFYDESTASFSPPPSIDTLLEPGQGVLVYIFENDDNTEPVTGNLERTISISGEEPADFGRLLSYTTNDGAEDGGWNLFGNPFNESLSVSELDLLLNENINSNLYVWNANACASEPCGDEEGQTSWGKYEVLSSSDIEAVISPFQGFWAKTEAEAQQFEFTKNAATSGSDFFKRAAFPGKFTLTFSGNRGVTGNSFFFDNEGSEQINNRDAYYLTPLSASYSALFFKKGQGKFLRGFYPLEFENEITIPLYLETTNSLSGTISADLDDIPADWTVLLKDEQTGDTWNLRDEDVAVDLVVSESNIKMKEMNTEPAFNLAGTSGIQKFSLIIRQGIVTSSGADDKILPQTVSLDQNYPNPFNPVTMIGFQLPVNSDVRLEVFDVLGRRVATLLNEPMQPGTHQVEFNASNLASGVYIYRLQTSQSVLTRQLTLIK
ncbi:MAG: endonuclease [Cyclonatronaceae bacterium]